jgi:hypothetical protein
VHSGEENHEKKNIKRRTTAPGYLLAGETRRESGEDKREFAELLRRRKR